MTNAGMEALIPLVNKLQDAFSHTGQYSKPLFFYLFMFLWRAVLKP